MNGIGSLCLRAALLLFGATAVFADGSLSAFGSRIVLPDEALVPVTQLAAGQLHSLALRTKHFCVVDPWPMPSHGFFSITPEIYKYLLRFDSMGILGTRIIRPVIMIIPNAILRH